MICKTKNILVLLSFIFPIGVQSQVLVESDTSELRLGVELQLDAIACDECIKDDGIRVANISSRYNYFTSINSLVFAEVSINLADDVSTESFSNSSETTKQSPENDMVDSALVGSQIENIEISIGNQFPVSKEFGPTLNSYIGLNLSAFDDDRYLISNGMTDNIVFRADWGDRYRYVVSFGAAENDNLIPDLNYELFIDAPLSESGGVYVSGAFKSMDIKEPEDFIAAGVKLSWFQNNGTLFELAYSKNDLGNYTELLFQRDCGSRHRLELGVTNFDEDPDGDIQEIDVISDSRFAYASYTFSISRTLRWFVERSVFYSDSFNSKAWLTGLEFSF